MSEPSEPSEPPEPSGRRPPAEPPELRRLDPGCPPPAIEDEPAVPPSRPVIETRRYGAIIGIIGLIVVVVVSVLQFASHGIGTTGVPPGQPLHIFAAPLAASTLNGDPTADPTCSQSRHDPRALNICLMEARGPLVLSFFVAGAAECVRQVDALQQLAARFPAVQFAAVAINGSHRATARLVARHHWTIPVAYDRDGEVGSLYSVAACPMAELAARGGRVTDRLIGDPWQSAAALAPRVRALASARRTP